MAPGILALVVLLALPAPCSPLKRAKRPPAVKKGDSVTLTLGGGRKITGIYLERKDGSVWVAVDQGEIGVDTKTIREMHVEDSATAEFRKRLSALQEKDADGHFALAEWARAKGLEGSAIAEAQRVIALDREDTRAHVFLGFAGQSDGKWLTREEAHARGVVVQIPVRQPRSYISPQQPPPLAPEPAKNAWRVSGTVYDLATMQPVSGAIITFRGPSQETATAAADSSGRYVIDLPKKDGWTVNGVGGGGYGGYFRPGQLLDVDPSYLNSDAEERRAVVEHTSDEDLAPVQVGWKLTDSKVRLDLMGVPRGWPPGLPRRAPGPPPAHR
jgi:hypothetical protein